MDSTAAATGSKSRPSRSGSTWAIEQIGAAGLRVPAALADVHSLGPRRGGARLHPVRVKDGNRVAGRSAGLPGGGDGRPVRAPDHQGARLGVGHVGVCGVEAWHRTADGVRQAELFTTPTGANGLRIDRFVRPVGNCPHSDSVPRSRCRGTGTPSGRTELPTRVIRRSRDGESLLVDGHVMPPAQQHQIVQIRWATLQPVDDVVRLQVGQPVAPGERAPAVPDPQRPPQRRGDLPGLPAQSQLLTRESRSSSTPPVPHHRQSAARSADQRRARSRSGSPGVVMHG